MQGQAPAKLAVLVSGTGTILEAMLKTDLPIALVVADRPCRGLDIAAQAGVPAELVRRASFKADFDREAYTHDVLTVLDRHGVDFIALAGFMTIFSPGLFDRYAGRVTNTHPALLPNFRGGHAVQDALAAGVEVTGCTIHIATAELDAGPILAQAEVPVLPGDTVDTLQERIKQVERTLYPETIRQLITKVSVA